MSEHDEFSFDKGLKDDYEGVIVDAWFGVAEGTDRLHLFLKKVADDGEQVEDRYPVGAEWASFDGGVTAEHASKSRLRADSGVAVLTSKAMECGAEEVLRERSQANDSLGPKTAKLWPGLKFHWTVESKPFNFKDQKTGEQVEGLSNRSYPDRFVGVEEVVDDEGTASPGSSTTSSTGGDNSAAASDPLDSVDQATATKLKILAQSKPYSQWVDEALALTEVRESETLLATLGDEGFYNKLRG